MSDIVPAADIERIVGRKRHTQAHYGRAATDEQTVYILHSQRCLDSGIDLRNCRFSLALDRGISLRAWEGMEGRSVPLGVCGGLLIPLTIPKG